jgi:hypothetical protein
MASFLRNEMHDYIRGAFKPKAKVAMGGDCGYTTLFRARFVKLRYDEGCTYREIAESCHESWGGEWTPPAHPAMGLCLVEVAQEILGDFEK